MTQDKMDTGMTAFAVNSNDRGGYSPAALFDAQEQSVLALAARDPVASIAFDKRKRHGWRALVFGAPFNFCLANDKLEALRVTAILLREGRAEAEQFYRFRMAGYSRAQFDALAVMFAGAQIEVAVSASFDLTEYREAA
jgi:hypothetical protein